MKPNRIPTRRHTARNLAPEGLLIASLWLLPTLAHAQAIESWVQRFNGPLNVQDYPTAMAMDTNANVYVTGYSVGSGPTFDYLTIKYSATGVAVWTNWHIGPGNGTDQANAVAVDSASNVYVTGTATVGYGDTRCMTIKYSGDGVPLWTNRFSELGGSGRALSVDGNGNLLVAAAVDTAGISPERDDVCWTIKYSGAGGLLWAKSFNSPGKQMGDGFRAIAADAVGNVVVTGESQGQSLTIKYSGAGTPLWTNRYSASPTNRSGAVALALDGSGNVFVTGSVWGNGSSYATIAYSSAGVPLWTNCYQGPQKAEDHAHAIGLDASGNVLVTGYSWSGYATIKYSNAGVPLWTNRTEGDWGRTAGIAVDALGYSYLTGTSGENYLTIGYSSSGVPLWTNRYNGPGNGRDIARSAAVDSNGSVFVVGSSDGIGTGPDYATIKYVVPPIIARQPLSCTNAVGTTASFSVEAAGGLPLSYQWRRQGTNLVNGGNVSGVTSTNLIVSNVQLAEAAGYSVVVTNAYGSATSIVAQLTVLIPPNPGRFTNFSYSPVMGFSFIFRDATIGLPVRIQRSFSLQPGNWTDWQSFTYTEPTFLTDLGATGQQRRFYRAVSP